jgi:hypothetical protein
MQAPPAPRLVLPFDATAALLRPAYAVPAGGLPVFPPAWHGVPSARALVLRHEDGRMLTITAGSSTVDMRRVAMVGVGAVRLSIHTDGASCQAQWPAAGTTYRLAARMTLGPFMELLFGLLWG